MWVWRWGSGSDPASLGTIAEWCRDLRRSVLGLVQHQMPMTPCGGQATSPISPADARRSQRSAALMRLANEGILVDTSLPQVCSPTPRCSVRNLMHCSHASHKTACEAVWV